MKGMKKVSCLTVVTIMVVCFVIAAQAFAGFAEPLVVEPPNNGMAWLKLETTPGSIVYDVTIIKLEPAYGGICHWEVYQTLEEIDSDTYVSVEPGGYFVIYCLNVKECNDREHIGSFSVTPPYTTTVWFDHGRVSFGYVK